MAIGRIAGPMLISDLDRQGLDLQFSTNNYPLIYLNFSTFQLGVNTSATTEALTVEGNISVNSSIKTTSTNQHLYITPNGTGQVIISNVNVIRGNINATDIGSITPAAAFFTTANTTSKATFATAQVQNLNDGRIVTSDGVGLIDYDGLKWFAANSTLYATNILSAGTVGYSSLTLDQFYYNAGAPTQVGYFASNLMLSSSPGLTFFSGNSLLRTSNVRVVGQRTGQILYTDSSNTIVGSSALTYDGTNMTATGITVLSGLQFFNTTITGLINDADIILNPAGAGMVNVNSHRITNVSAPLVDGDAATKAYVDALTAGVGANIIKQFDSRVIVRDNGAGIANVSVVLQGTTLGQFTQDGNIRFASYTINNNNLYAPGDIVFVPGAGVVTSSKFIVNGTSSITLPVGLTSQRPVLPAIGDIRYNSDIGTVEWYTGSAWITASGAVTISSQVIYPSGITDTFTLTQTATTETVLVSINGTLQQPSTAYSVVGTTLTFVEIPLATDIIEVRFLAASIAYASNPILVNNTYTTVITGGTTVDQFNIASYRSAIYQFSAKNATTSQFQVGEVYLVHDSVTANVQTFTRSRVGTQTDLITWSASISGLGVVSFIATAASGTGSTKVKLHRTYFDDGS